MEFRFTPDDEQFLADHRHLDPDRLILQRSMYPNLNLALICEQLKLENKVKIKLPTFHEKNALVTRLSYEQCTPEWVARAKANRFKPADMQDVTGGLGVDSWAFALHGNVVAWEHQEFIHKLAVYNGHKLGQPYPKRELGSLLNQHNWPYAEWYLIDPDRRPDGNRRVGLAALEPDLLMWWNAIQKHSKHQLVKLSPAFDQKVISRQLAGVKHIMVIEWENAVREICVHASTGYQGPIETEAWLVHGNDTKVATLSPHTTKLPLYRPDKNHYVWDPPPAWIKSHYWEQAVAENAGFVAGENTTLGFFDHLPTALPGRFYQIVTVLTYQRKSVQTYMNLSQLHAASVGRKDFPVGTEEFRKQHRLAEHPIETIWLAARHLFIHCRKIASR